MTKNRRWAIQFDSHDELMKAKDQVEPNIRLDRVYTDISVSFPGGVEEKRIEHHKFSDYFDDIKMIVSNKNEAKHFMILEFYVKENAKNFYKDLMVDIIIKISDRWARCETC